MKPGYHARPADSMGYSRMPIDNTAARNERGRLPVSGCNTAVPWQSRNKNKRQSPSLPGKGE